MPRSRAFLAFMLIAGLTACESGLPLDSTTGSGSDDALVELLASSAGGDPRSNGRGNLMDRLAAEIPGFGGLYRSGPCAVTVVLTDLSRAEHAIAVVSAALRPLIGDACPDGVRVTPERGDFTYIELMRWLHASRELLLIDGVPDTRVDFKLNRLVVVVTSHAAAAAVIEQLPRLGIPEEAVAFESRGAAPPTRPGAAPQRPDTTRTAPGTPTTPPTRRG